MNSPLGLYSSIAFNLQFASTADLSCAKRSVGTISATTALKTQLTRCDVPPIDTPRLAMLLLRQNEYPDATKRAGARRELEDKRVVSC